MFRPISAYISMPLCPSTQPHWRCQRKRNKRLEGKGRDGRQQRLPPTIEDVVELVVSCSSEQLSWFGWPPGLFIDGPPKNVSDTAVDAILMPNRECERILLSESLACVLSLSQTCKKSHMPLLLYFTATQKT